MSSDDENLPSDDFEPHSQAADQPLTEKVLAALCAIPGHDLDEDKLRHIAKQIARQIAASSRNIPLLIAGLQAKPHQFQAALEPDALNMPITLTQAVKLLPAYWNVKPDTVANKLASFIAACQEKYSVKIDYQRVVSKPSMLRSIAYRAPNRILELGASQHQLLATNNIEIDTPLYIEKALEIPTTLDRMPMVILDGAKFILASHNLNSISPSLDARSRGDIILKNLHFIGHSSNHLAAILIHKQLAPLLLQKSQLISFSLGTLLKNTRLGILLRDELFKMLGVKEENNPFDPAAESMTGLMSALQDNRQRKIDLVTMLVKLGFVPRCSLDPKLFPPDVQNIKHGAYGDDSPARQRQKYYAREYFGEEADELSIFELYQKVLGSSQWKAVVEPAQAALARRQEQFAAAAAKIRKDQAEVNKALTKEGLLSKPSRPGSRTAARGHPPKNRSI